MERLFNDGWEFVKLANGSTLADVQQADWARVDLPHDFLIAQADDLYQNADGWYRRTLTVPKAWLTREVILRFDGVYMDCDVLLNGEVICTHHYGYTCFDAVLTGHLHAGKNVLHVHIRHQSPNSRWYSGAGIYRDVTLHVLLPMRHITLDGVYATAVRQGDDWLLTIDTEIVGAEACLPVVHLLTDGQGFTKTVADVKGSVTMNIPSPRLWQVDDPFCYTLTTVCGDQCIRQNIGFREFTFTADRGLLVNGQPVKLHGVCLHHDLGCLGSAFHEKAARRQLLAMKRMGVNSLRTSHNPPAKQVMDLCDELGILVVDEIFDMWQQPKTPYDYARFFDADAPSDVAAWVRRDRNHPSLLMWSIGNEIGDTHNQPEQAGRVAQMLCACVRQHDPRGNGITTLGSNYMHWAGAQHCAQFVQAVGYNYGEKLYEKHHADHPEWVIYGSETASIVSSRGVYRFPMDAPILTDDDLQCSSLGNSRTSWGTQHLPKMIVDDLNCPYSLGQYIWMGIDYIGEPTPYHTRNSYFGAMDTAVFPKDFWYLYQSLWTDAPMVHIGVQWDWNPGQMIDVPVMTNAASAELFLNGESLGRRTVDRHDAADCCPVWHVPFAPGELRAVACDADGLVVAEDRRCTPGDAMHIRLTAEDAVLPADGRDMTFITIEMLDEQGHIVENAVDRVQVQVTGQGMLMGLDNGDSTDADGYQTTSRRLFSGKLLAVVGAGTKSGTVQVTVTSAGKQSAVLTIPVLDATVQEGVSRRIALCRDETRADTEHIRRIALIPMGEKRLTPEHPTVTFRVVTCPDTAPAQPITYRITNAKGIESPCAVCHAQEDTVTVEGVGDGTVYLRASVTNGAAHARIISQQEIDVSGMGQPNLNPYGFVSAGLFDVHAGDISSGNEQGIAFARDGESMVGFTHVDFGAVGSDEITLPIFALDSDLHTLHMWDGVPGDGGRLIAPLPYQKPSRWNVYQPETYRLPERLTGLHTLCFSLTEKVHLKGFSFTRQSRAWLPQRALEADAIYGDSFVRDAQAVRQIGNNVSLVFEQMDFADCTHASLMLKGFTPLKENPITIRIVNEAGESVTALAQFRGDGAPEQTFPVAVLPGVCTVSFVFLPGCQFDFDGFCFIRDSQPDSL